MEFLEREKYARFGSIKVVHPFYLVFIGVAKKAFFKESSLLSLVTYSRECIMKCLADSKEDQAKGKRGS